MSINNMCELLTADYFGSDPKRKKWARVLKTEFDLPYMRYLRKFLHKEETDHVIYPKCSDVFRSLEETPLPEVKVVIIGQDPYYNGAADGLAFSMSKKNWKKNNALKQIFVALRKDGYKAPSHPCSLLPWARKGVLLLNSVLTVREKCPRSHTSKGWERFTDRVVEIVNDEQDFVVFLLWGDQAKKKGPIIDRKKHKVLEAAHPMRFGGCCFQNIRHFSQINCHLNKRNKESIDWSLC